MVKMLMDKAEILCDDRMIVRGWPDGFKIHGTWSHGEVADISPNSAPLNAVFFLEKARENQVLPLEDRGEVMKRLLACLIRPFITREWWEKTLSVLEGLAKTVPCYTMRFEKSGGIVDLLDV